MTSTMRLRCATKRACTCGIRRALTTREIYEAKAERWLTLWPKLTVVLWDYQTAI